MRKADYATAMIVAMMLSPAASHAQQSKPAAKSASAAKSNPFIVENWVSLAPAPGSAEARLGMSAEAPSVETITVIGQRHAIPEERLFPTSTPGESWHSDAAQPMVPGLGDSCSYKSGCFDKDQTGLFTSLPALLGNN
jgi:hypothetical protein